MSYPDPLNTPQVPTATPSAVLGATPVLPTPPESPAPVIQSPPPTPFSVALTDERGGLTVGVTSAKLQLSRVGSGTTQGTVELRSRLRSDPSVHTLLAVANAATPYTIVISYFGPDGVALRVDNIAVSSQSSVVYRGPELSESENGWEFFETLTIHA